MSEYDIYLGMHKKIRNPDLEPFLFNQETKFKLILGIIVLPLIITASILLTIVFLDQEIIFLFLVPFGLIFLVIGITSTQITYRKLKQFNITGSVIQDFIKLLEIVGWRIQAAVWPILILLFIFSFIGGNGEEGDSLPINSILQIIGIVLILIGALLILNSLLNYIDSHNQRIMGLDDRSPDEDFRNELKSWGKKIGFDDVKVRLAEIPPNNYGHLAVTGKVDNTVYLAYSKIAQFQAKSEHSLVYCVRELCWILLENKSRFYILTSVHNLLFTLYLGLLGLMIYSSSSGTNIIQEKMGIFCIGVVILIIVADSFIKVYISSYDLLLELQADNDTIELLTDDNRSADNIKRILRLTEDVDPLSTSYPGFKFRRSALQPKKEYKGYWDKL